MKNLIKTSAISIATLGMAFSVFAQSPTPTPTPTSTKTPIREQVRDIRDTRKEGMEEIRDIRTVTKEEAGNLRREFQDKIRDARAALKAKIDEKRAVLKADLKKVKDERKQQTTEKIDKNLDALNERMTNHFSNTLDKLEDILVRIDERTDRASSQSIDVSSVRVAIASASQSIIDARAAVVAQAGKTYKVTITTEVGLKDAVKKARQALHDDLAALRERVKAARDAVHDAARAYAKAHGRDLPSPSASPSPSSSVFPTTTP